MEETLDLDYNENKGIPTFLKVLCILTFVGAGFGILSSLYSMMTHATTVASLEMMGDNPYLASMSNDFVAVTKKWGMLSYGLTLVGNLLCLFGALMMWKLKKTGFYIYVVGQILPLVATFGLFGGLTSGGGMMAGFLLFGQIFATLFPIAFIIMYGVNLKHMK